MSRIPSKLILRLDLIVVAMNAATLGVIGASRFLATDDISIRLFVLCAASITTAGGAMVFYVQVKSRLSGGGSGRSFWLDVLLPMAIQQDVQANLQELMPLWILAHGERRARIIRRVQVARIVVGHNFNAALDLAGKIVRIVTGQ